MFDTRYIEQITAVERIFLARFGTMPTIIDRYKTHNYFQTADREGWFGYKWIKYITTGGESKVIKTPYGTSLSTGSEADSKITNERCKVIDELRNAYSALNKYQKERVSRTAGSGEPDDATNSVIEFLKDLLTFLSTIEDEKTLVTGLQQTQFFINDIIIHPGRGDGKGLFPTTDNKFGVNIHAYSFKGALGDAWSHLKSAEEHLDLLSKEVEINRLFNQVKDLNRTVLRLMLRHATVLMRDVHNQSYAEIINVNSIRDDKKMDNQSFIHTESGKLARLTALCPAHRYNFPEDRAGLRTGLDASLNEPVLSEFLEATLLDCSFVKIRRSTDQDDRKQHKEFEVYFDDEPDNFKIIFDGHEYTFNLMNGNSGIFKIFAKDRELQKLYRVYFAIQQQISKCQMAIAVGSSLASKNGESAFRIALDQHTHHLCNILQFYYDTSITVINLIVNQCRSAQRAYTTQSSYVPFSKLVKDGKVLNLPYVVGNVFHPNECVVDLIKGVSDKEFGAWFNNFNSLQTCESDILKHLKSLKILVSQIGGICKEGMTATEQAKIRQQAQVYAAMAVKLADEHNSQNDSAIEARNPDAMPKLTLDEIRDLGETAENAFVMLLVLGFDGASRNKIASRIGTINKVEKIAQELINGRDFSRNPDPLDQSIPLDFRKESINEFNCLWWILKVYIAGIKQRSNTTVEIQNKFITDINSNLLNSSNINLEHIFLIGCSLASIGTKAAREKLKLVYALIQKRVIEYKSLYEHSEEEDKPDVHVILVKLNLYRTLIGLSLRDCSVPKLPVTIKHWCIDTEQSLQGITFCPQDIQDRLNELLVDIRPVCGTHLIDLLKKKYQGNAVARIDHMNVPLTPAPKGVAQAPLPPQPKAPPAAAGKGSVVPATIIRQVSSPALADDDEDILVSLKIQRRRYAEMARQGTLQGPDVQAYTDLDRVIKNIEIERANPQEYHPASNSRGGSGNSSGQRSLQGSRRPTPPSDAPMAEVYPAGAQLPSMPPPQDDPTALRPPPTPVAPPTPAPAPPAAAKQLGYNMAAVGFFPGSSFFAQPAPASVPPAALSRVPSEVLLPVSPSALPAPALTNSAGSNKYGSAARGVLSPTAAVPASSSGSSIFSADPNNPRFHTLQRRDSEAVPPGTVPATSNTGLGGTPATLRLKNNGAN